jgi:hypothetical protein
MTVVHLDLQNHCIETEIKHHYNRILNRLLKSRAAETDLENQLELMLLALESFDFSYLRSRSRALAGGLAGADVQLRAGSAGGVDLYVDGEIIESARKGPPPRI